MYEDFDEKIKSEIIVLPNLKNITSNSYCEYYSSWDMEWEKEKENPNKSKEEIKAEINEEIKSKIKNLKKESMKFYQIDNKKNKELEQLFSQIKLKINFNSKPNILRDGKFYTISNGCCTIYNEKLFNKLYEIKFEENINVTSAIQLDNKDLVFFTENQLIIFRLKNGKYILLQKIDENKAGYRSQNSYSGCFAYTKRYRAEFIKDISENRFICGNNYGFKIYSLNEKNEYSIVLLESYSEGQKIILELDKDTFIFCTKIECGDSLGGPAHNILVIDKIHLKKITKEEKEKRLNNFNQRDYCNDDDDFFGPRNPKPTKKITEEENKSVIGFLKYTFNANNFFKYSKYGSHHYFKGYTILKNKILIIGIDNNILIFDILSEKLLKRYIMLLEGENNLFISSANIKKWNNNNDNEFFINYNGNIILFELTKNNELKIISQSYFKDIISLKRFDEKNNKFYDDGSKENSYFSRWFSYKENENQNCIATIFY